MASSIFITNGICLILNSKYNVIQIQKVHSCLKTLQMWEQQFWGSVWAEDMWKTLRQEWKKLDSGRARFPKPSTRDKYCSLFHSLDVLQSLHWKKWLHTMTASPLLDAWVTWAFLQLIRAWSQWKDHVPLKGVILRVWVGVTAICSLKYPPLDLSIGW